MASATSTPVASSGRFSRSAARRSAATGLPASSTSPTCRSRSQEKDELRNLNDRLANYIQRVQELESERSSVLLHLEEKGESKIREMGNVRRLYEEELADVRKTLDDLAGERARLQIDYGDLRDEYRKLQARYQKKESDLANALTQWRNVEAALSTKDADCTKLLSQNRQLKDDFSDLQGQLENVKGILSDTKNQLSSEILKRLDSGARRDFDNKLAEVMQQLRKDHESQVQQYKDEIDRTFTSKLQNAQQAVLEKTNALTATKDELETTKFRKIVLESRFQDMERTLDREREVWQQKLTQKEQEMLNIRSQMYSQLEDYENLLDVKLALDMEINAYRKMLEVEEQRLQLSPSPSQRTTVPRTHEHSGRKLGGKKRKHEGAQGSSPACKMSSRSTDSGTVSVAEVDINGKYVRLKNHTETDQPLGGWVIRRMFPDSGDISFNIPSSCGHRNWGHSSDVRVVLLNPNNEEMAERRVYKQSRGEEDTALEFDEDFVAGSDIHHYQRQDLSKEANCAIM
ncbi:hypothetical protein INR49_002769 [Caranx melampygus]|nr:hypothetical protein INR49_002769 [Caranx melampygus]